MNYVLGELEARGYVERRSERESAVRRVRLTRRGRAVIAAMRACLAAIEREWSDLLGARRFQALRATLRDLSLHLGRLA
jgi:DNA-binding MarR family transcriptional regulator